MCVVIVFAQSEQQFCVMWKSIKYQMTFSESVIVHKDEQQNGTNPSIKQEQWATLSCGRRGQARHTTAHEEI